MNTLKTYSVATAQADTFLVYWTNSTVRPRGVLKVCVRPQIEDRQIAAELAALQYLLEEKRVIGTNLVGNPHTRLTVSLGAIRKLQRRLSDKAHLASYANFLTTRFAGCQLVVEKDTRWFEDVALEEAEELLVGAPRREVVRLTGLGEVAVTHHVLNRLADRFMTDVSADKQAAATWKRLNETATDPQLREVSRPGCWNGVKYAQLGKKEGRYFLSSRRQLVLVVTDNPGEGKRLVTAYPVTKHFQALPIAA
jgi:hypothetical protein